MSWPIYWHATADCATEDVARLAELADRLPAAQFEGGSAIGGVVSIRYLSGSPTLIGVATAGAGALRRAFGVARVDVLTLYREIDGAVFEVDNVHTTE